MWSSKRRWKRQTHNEEEDKNPQDSTLLRLEDLSMETEQHLPRDTGKQNMSVGANITFEESLPIWMAQIWTMIISDFIVPIH